MLWIMHFSKLGTITCAPAACVGRALAGLSVHPLRMACSG